MKENICWYIWCNNGLNLNMGGHIMKRMLLGIGVVLGVAGMAKAGDLPTVEEVLDCFVEAVGGREVLLERDQLCFAGTIVQDLSWKDPQHSEVPFKACGSQDGQFFYVESDSWADLPEEDIGEPRAKLRWVMHPAFALVVEDFFPDLEVIEIQQRAGREVVVLAPRDMKFGNYALYFDRETGLLNHLGYHNDLEDWRKVEGVLRPHVFVFGRKGGHTTYHFEDFRESPEG